jgi:hypothetical protein
MTKQLPALFLPAALTTTADTYIVYIMPALIVNAGDAAGWRYIEFFTANTARTAAGPLPGHWTVHRHVTKASSIACASALIVIEHEKGGRTQHWHDPRRGAVAKCRLLFLVRGEARLS